MPVLSAAIGVPVVARLPLWSLLVRPSQCGSRKAYDQSDGEKDGLHEKPPFAPRHKTVISVAVIKVQLIAMRDLPLPPSPFQPLAAQRVAGEKQARPQSRPPRRAARRLQPKRPLGGGGCAGKGKRRPAMRAGADGLRVRTGIKKRESLAPRPSSPRRCAGVSLSSARESNCKQIRQAWRISGDLTEANKK
jgi:hypothetical protein